MRGKVFVSVPAAAMLDPVWSGHESALRVYYCLLFRVRTPEDSNEPIRFNDIAEDLGCSWRSVRKAVKWLREKELIITTWDEAAQAYRYAFPEGGRFA